MAYTLSGTDLRAPTNFSEQQDSLMAQQRTLDGNKHRDYFGTLKRIWVLNYDNVNATDYATIYTLFQSYISADTPLTWQVTESNYIVSATTVHVDLRERQFNVKGSDYLSSFTLVLTEA